MKKIFQYIILFLFFIFVVGLWFFAYKMASNVLIFAFQGQEQQEWKYVILTVNRPGVISRILPSWALLDEEALKNSLLLNGEKVFVDDFDMEFSESFVKIVPKNTKNGDIFTISANLYNAKKRTSFQLPKDVTLNISDNVSDDITITAVQNASKKTQFSVQSEKITKELLRFYAYYPDSGESCTDGENVWNYKKYFPLDILQNDGENEIISFELDNTKKRQCVITGYGNTVILALDRELPDFSLNAVLNKNTNNEKIFQNTINISSTSPIIFRDNVQDQNILGGVKKKILENITFSPELMISEDNITVTENGFSLMAEFEDNVNYTMFINDLEDIYGRTNSLKFSFTPKNNTYMGIDISWEKKIFSSVDDILMNVYSNNEQKKNFDIKVCRLDVTAFSQISQIISEKNKEKIPQIYELLTSSRSSECQKTNINFSEKWSTINFSLWEKFDKKSFRPGLYTLAFRDFSDIDIIEQWVFPEVFAIANTEISAEMTEYGLGNIFTANMNGEKMKNQELEIFVQNSDNNEIISYATGSIIWKTNESGKIVYDFSDFSEKNAFFVSRSRDSFGYLSLQFPKFWEKPKEYRVNMQINGMNFLKNDTVNIFANIRKNSEIPQNDVFQIFLKNPLGDIVKKWDMKPNQNGVIFAQYQFRDEDIFGDYTVSIFLSNMEKIEEKSITLWWEKTVKNGVWIDFSLLDSSDNIPKNLRERNNTIGSKNYYTYEYFAPIELDVKAFATNAFGKKMKNTPFEYMLFRKKYDSDEEMIYEWKWNFDAEWVWRVLLATEFSSFFHDVRYRILVKTQDIITGESIFNEKILNVSLPKNLQVFDDNFSPEFVLEKEFLQMNEEIIFEFITKNVENISQKYIYEILDASQTVVKKDVVKGKKVQWGKIDFSPWKYTIRVSPILDEGVIPPKMTIFEKTFFVLGDKENTTSSISVFLNRKQDSNTFDMLIVAPKDTKNVIISRTENNTLISEMIAMSGGILRKEVVFSDDAKEQILQVFAHTNNTTFSAKRSIIPMRKIQFPDVDFSDIDRAVNENWQNAKIIFKNFDAKNSGNISLKIVEGDAIIDDENIFLQKNPTRTAFFSQNLQTKLSEFSLIKNHTKPDYYEKNIYFNPSATLNAKNELLFQIPELRAEQKYSIVVEYIAINGEKKVFQKSIVAKHNFRISSDIPNRVFPGDKADMTIFVKNFTNTISPVEWQLEFFHENTPLSIFGNMNVNVLQTETDLANMKIPENWRGKIPFTLSLKKNNAVVAVQNGEIFVDEIPSMGLGKNTIWWTNSSAEILLENNELLSDEKSLVDIRVASDFSVILPWLLEDLQNAKKITIVEKLQELSLKNALQKNQRFAFMNAENLSENLGKILEKESFATWKNDFSDDEMLDAMILLFSLHKSGLSLPNSWFADLEQYFTKNILEKIDEKSPDIRTKISLIRTILSGDIDDVIFTKIDKNALSNEGFLNYMENFLRAKRVISQELYDEFLTRFEAKKSENSLPFFERIFLAKYTRIGFLSGKSEKANEILSKNFLIKTLGMASIREKYELWLLALAHENIATKQEKTVKITSENIAADAKISQKNPLAFWQVSRDKIKKNAKIVSENSTPIFYEIREKNTLEVPSLFAKRESPFFQISQKIEKIDEKSGVNEKWDFRKKEEISNNFLEKNALYKTTISVETKNLKNEKWWKLAVRAYVPTGVEIFAPKRNIQEFLGKSFPLDFSKISFESQYILLEKNAWEWEKTLNFVYYFRPKNSGSYLLPGNFVYFVDGKEFFANSAHQYFHIK